MTKRKPLPFDKVLIRDNKASDLAQSNAKKWRPQIKSLTGPDRAKKQAWYHQFLMIEIFHKMDTLNFSSSRDRSNRNSPRFAILRERGVS